MPRMLMLIILGYLLYKLIKRLLTNTDANNKQTKKPEEKMLQCSRCGCYAPISETKQKNNQVICNNPECQA